MDAALWKTCTGCGLTKAVADFYNKHGRCRACYCKWQTAYNRTVAVRDKAKIRARHLLAVAIKKGTVTRPASCSKCATACIPEGHHEDYSKPLEVVWVCTACHMAGHKNNIRRKSA